jgi:hypothetical protein
LLPQVACSTTNYAASSHIVPPCRQLQGNTIDNHLDLDFEPNQDEINAMDEVEKHIKDIENIFDQRWAESIKIEIGSTGTEGEQKGQHRIGAKEEGKYVKSIGVAGAVKEGNAKNEEEVS